MGKHTFDPKHISSLEDPKRLFYEDPDSILSAFSIDQIKTGVDIGAGTGFYTRSLFRRLAAAGFIWACDVSWEVLQWLLGNLKADQRQRIGLVQIGENALPFASETVDLAIMANVLHEFDNPGKIMQEVHRIVKAEGQAVVVDWKKEEAPFGPPYAHRVSLQDIETLLEEAGFSTLQPPLILERHNALLVGK
jgi:ubiquinone/menaquinone biosynthesis C-methylase UbiE